MFDGGHKMKKILTLSIIMLALVGCSNSIPATVVCSVEDEETTITDTMVSKGDKVQTSTLVAVSDYEVEIEEAEYTTEDLEIVHELRKANYANLDGVKYEYEVNGTIVTETLSFDYEKTSFEDLYEADLLDNPKSDYISLSQTQKNYENQGFNCIVE